MKQLHCSCCGPDPVSGVDDMNLVGDPEGELVLKYARNSAMWERHVAPYLVN